MPKEIPESLPDGEVVRPSITSYDSGYEHSFEHYVYVRKLVEEAHEEFLECAPDAEERITALAS